MQFPKTQNAYIWIVVCLYANYVLIGIEQIAVAQHMDAFMVRLGTDVGSLALIISATALGRGIGGCFSGFLSDRFGRKIVTVAGTLGISLSFAGLVTAPTPLYVFIAVFFGGTADALIDAGAFATFAEAFPKSSASKAVGTKISISAGQIVFPVCVAWLISEEISLDVSLTVVACLALVNFIFLMGLKFPDFKPSQGFLKAGVKPVSVYPLRRMPTFKTDGIPLLVFAGCAYVSFSIVLIWMPLISREVALATVAQSLTTVSYFAAGSILFGLVSVYLMKRWIRPVLLMTLLPVVTAIGAFAVWMWPSVTMCRAVSFVIGASAAGGIFQIGVAVSIDFFPAAKGRMSMAYILTSALTGAVATFLLGHLATYRIDLLMLVNVVIALLNAIVGLVIVIRFYKTFVIRDHRWLEAFILRGLNRLLGYQIS